MGREDQAVGAVHVSAHEVVIRFGRPFDVHTTGGAFLASVREITVPFADRESAEAAQREITVFARPVHDAGGEDYRPVVAGEVVAPAPGIEGTVRTSSSLTGFTDVETRVIPAGVLQVSSSYAAIMADDPAPKVIGWQCTLRKATLNGELVTDPRRAQALADEAGMRLPGPFTWNKP